MKSAFDRVLNVTLKRYASYLADESRCASIRCMGLLHQQDPVYVATLKSLRDKADPADLVRDLEVALQVYALERSPKEAKDLTKLTFRLAAVRIYALRYLRVICPKKAKQ